MGVIQQNVVNQRPADFLNVTANLQQDPNSASNSNEITQRYNAGDLIAIVGTQPVLEGEIASVVDPILEKNKDRIREQDLDGIRSKLSREALTHRIETLALAQHFVSGLSEGGSTKEQAEFKKKILPKLVEAFHTQVVPARMKQAGVNTPNELDAELRKSGSSLASLLVQFQDQILAEEAINSSVPKKVNVTLADLRDYYANHTEEWAKPARAKWRQITVKFSNHASREEAFEAIKQYGNEVILGGAPFEAVAKKYSEDFSSTDGGLYEWVTQGSLKSKEIDSTVFAIPLEKSSEIIEDEVGYHIVIVLDREDARLISMSEAQLDMQQKIQTTRKDELKRELIEKVMAKTAIWSRWPDDFANAKPLSEAILQR
jgi:parvulin-like peptidyl-prolyl isomerase